MIQYDKMSFQDGLTVRLGQILFGWEHLACENSLDSSLDIAQTASNLINETLRVSLKSQWPLDDNSVKSHLVSLLDVSYRKLSEICKETSAMCRALMELVPNPWGSPVLQSIMNKPNIVSHEACVSFCSMEHPDVLKARIEILMESRHDELAYNLAMCCQQCGSPGGETFYKEAIIILNYRLGQIYRLTEVMSKMSCCSGVQFINRLLDVNVTSKLALAECLTQVLLVHDLVCTSQFCCTAALMKLWVRLHVKSKTSLEYLKPQVKKLAALALTSAHQYLLVDVLYEQYGLDLMSLYIEVYVQAITMDINHLENLKLHEEHASILEMEAHLASVFTKMATLFDDEYCGVAKECILTAFTLEPTQDRLNTLEMHSLRLQDLERDWLPVLSPMMITAEEPKTGFIPRIPCQGECYCEEKGQCRQEPPALLDNTQNSDMACDDLPLPSVELTKMDTSDEMTDCSKLEKCWDLDDCSSIYPVYSPVIDSGLPGVSAEILKDLVIILESARSKSATWDKEWIRLGPSCEEYLVTETECKRIILESLELQIPVEIPNRHFQRRTNSWLPSANVQAEVPVPPSVSHTLLPEILDQCDNANPLEGDANVATCPTDIDVTKSLPASSWTPVDILNNLALPKTFKALDNSMSSSDVIVDKNELRLVAEPEVGTSPLTLQVVSKKKARRTVKVKNCIQTSGRKEVIVNAPSGQSYIVSVPLNRPPADGEDAVQESDYSVYSSRIQQCDQGCGASSGLANILLPSTTCTVGATPKLDFEGTIPKMVSDTATINCQNVVFRPVPVQQTNKRRSELKSNEGQQKRRKTMFASKKREQDGNMWFSVRNRHGLMEYKKARKKDLADGDCSEVPIGAPKKTRMHVVRSYNRHERSARAKMVLYGDQAKVSNNVQGIVLAPSKLIVPSQPQDPPQPPQDPPQPPQDPPDPPQPPPPSFPLVHLPVVEPENMEDMVVNATVVPTYPCPVMVPASSPVPADETSSVVRVQQVLDVQPEIKRVDSPVNTTTVVIVEPPPEPKVKVVTAPTCVDLHLDSMPIIVSETSPVVILSPLKDKFRITNPVCVLERLDAHVFTRELQAMKMMKLEREKTSYDKTLICDTCNKTLSSPYSLKRHLKAVHNLDSSPRLKLTRRGSSWSRKRMKHKRSHEDISKMPKCIEYVANDTDADVMSSRETEEVVIDVKGTHDPEGVDASEVVPCVSPSCSSSSDEGAESCGPASPCLSRTVSVDREDTEDDSLNSETEGGEPMECDAALRGEKCCPCCDDGSPKRFKTNLTQLRLYRKPQSLELSPRTRSTSQRLGSGCQ